MKNSRIIRLLLVSMMFMCIQPAYPVSAAFNCLSLSGTVGLSSEVVNQGDSINLNYNLRSEGSITSVQARKPADIILALDYSGSMAYPIDSDPRTNDSRLQAMQKASDTFLDELENVNQLDRVGLTSFSSTAPKYDNIPLTSTFTTIRNKINTWRADGGTNIEQALEVSQGMLTTSQPTTPKFIILLTDGYTTHYTYTDSKHRIITKNNDAEARRLALVNADQIGATDITIHTIALAQQGASNGNVDRALLRDIAKKTGGNMYDADNIEGLKQVFRTIVNDINEDDSFSKTKITQVLPEGVELADPTSNSSYIFNPTTRELTFNVEDIPYQGSKPITIPVKVNSHVGQVQFNPATINYKNLCGESSTLQVPFNSKLDVQKVVWDAYLNTYVSTKQGEIRRYQSTGSQATMGPLDWTFNTSGNVIENMILNEDGTKVDLYTVLNNINNPMYSLDLKPTAPTIVMPNPAFDKWLTGDVKVKASGSTITALSDYPGKFSNLSSAYTSNMIAGYEYRLNGTGWKSMDEPLLTTIENGTLEVAAITHAISKTNDANLIHGHPAEKVVSIDNTPPELPQLSIVNYDEVGHQYSLSVTHLIDKESGLQMSDSRAYSIQCVSCDLNTVVSYKPNNQFNISEHDYLAGQFSIHVVDKVGISNTLPLGIDVSILDNPTDNPWIRLTSILPTIKHLSVRLDAADPYVQVTDGSKFFMENVQNRFTSSNERVGLQILDILADYQLEDGSKFTYTHSIMFDVVPKLVTTKITDNPTDDPSITLSKLINTVNKISIQIDELGNFIEINSGQSYQLQDIHTSFTDRAQRLGRHQLITQVEHTLRDGTTAIHEEQSYFDVIPELYSVHISEIPNNNPEITVTQLTSFIDHLKVRLDGRDSFIEVTSGSPNLMEDIHTYYASEQRRVGWHKLEVIVQYDLGSGPVIETEEINFEVVPNLVDIVVSANPTDNPNLTFTALSTAVQDIEVKIDDLGSYEQVVSGSVNKMDTIQAIFADRTKRVGWHKLDVKVTYSLSDGTSAEHTLTTYFKVNPGIDAELQTRSATYPATKPVLIHISYDLPVVARWGKLAVTVKERYYAITNSSTRPADASSEWKVLRSDQFTVTETEKKDVYIHLRIVDTDGIIHQDPPVPLLISFNYKYDLY
jgi:Mg-chelatase subunit ChlD